MKSVILIAQVTFKELIREKTLHGLLVVFALISVFSLILGQLSFAEQVRLSLDFGLSVMHLSLIGLAIILGSQLIHRELERKTIFTLLVKPLTRTQYVFGKFIGLSSLLFFTALLCSVFLLLCMRYFGEFYEKEIFTSAFGQWLESSVLVSVVLLLGQRFKPAFTTFCAIALFLIGHWFETLEFLTQKNQDGSLALVYKFLSLTFPNLENWNWKGAVIYGEFLSLAELASLTAQGGLWCLVYLSLGSLFFERRDLVP
jgi:Cu-processing system permease protein